MKLPSPAAPCWGAPVCCPCWVPRAWICWFWGQQMSQKVLNRAPWPWVGCNWDFMGVGDVLDTTGMWKRGWVPMFLLFPFPNPPYPHPPPWCAPSLVSRWGPPLRFGLHPAAERLTRLTRAAELTSSELCISTLQGRAGRSSWDVVAAPLRPPRLACLRSPRFASAPGDAGGFLALPSGLYVVSGMFRGRGCFLEKLSCFLLRPELSQEGFPWWEALGNGHCPPGSQPMALHPPPSPLETFCSCFI